MIELIIELIEAFEPISTTEWMRIFLLYSHLVFCILAISAVLRTDLALMLGHYTPSELQSTATFISWLLLALWASGLGIVYLDTGFIPAQLLSKSKLLLKLMCVITLTLNGMVLHHISFPVLTRSSSGMSAGESVLLVTTGALSTSHWMLAAFIGMSRPLGMLPFSTLLSAYVLFVMAVLLISLFFIPLLARIKPAPLTETAYQ